MSMCGEIENVEREIAQLQKRLRMLKGEEEHEPYWEFISDIKKLIVTIMSQIKIKCFVLKITLDESPVISYC